MDRFPTIWTRRPRPSTGETYTVSESGRPSSSSSTVWLSVSIERAVTWGVAASTALGTCVSPVARWSCPSSSWGEHLTLDGVESANQAAAGVARLQGRWLAPFPDVGRESPLPFSPAGLIARENYDPRRSPANTCEPNNVPAVFHSPYLFDIQITAQQVVVRHEAYNVTRTVPLNSEPRRAEPSGVFGRVTGRIDGDELVIESSDFPASGWGLGVAGTTNGAGADVPSSTQKKLIERYSASGDGRTLTVGYILEDPIYLTEPYSDYVELTRVADDAPMYEYACELDNASRFSRER